MENASKALIIAGAILIAILLISVAIIVMNSTEGMQEQVADSTDTMGMRSFNSQFTIYEGSGRTVSEVKAVVSLAKSITARAVQVEFKTPLTGVVSLETGDTYNVELSYDKGYVNKVTISE